MTDAEKANILVVDDLPEKLLVMETVLAELGQNVITARSGEEALRKVLELDFAVILLDVNMPGINGLETAALIRKRKKSAYVPIIFITAFADEMRTAEGYSLGAVDYILSPVVPEILRTKVKVFVDLYRMSAQVRRQADERVALVREQMARAAAEEATRRSAFLAEASARLASSLDFQATVRNLAAVVVPFLADLGAVTLAEGDEGVHTTQASWTGPDRTAQSAGVESLPEALADAIVRVCRAGKTELLGAPCEGGAFGFVLDAAVVLPLRARGKTLGALTLAHGPSGRRFGPADLALAEDFADRAAVALDNARLYQQLAETDRRKDEFLSMLAHELRNPLAPIRNAVQVLRMCGTDRPEQQWARDVIDRQLAHLVRLVDDLLDVSRITRGKIRLHVEPIDLAVVIERAVETSRPLIEARRHELTVTLPPEPLCVQGDLARLAQVLANLLNNAAKYTPEGGRIWLTAALEGDEAVVRVRDTGVGIPGGMLNRVFDMFTQLDRSLDRSEGGLGIGLTLVRSLAEMHGGRVHAFSPGPNEGSEFVVRLPLLTGPGPTEPPPLSGVPEPMRGRTLRVLVVDDHRDAADSVALLLRLGGHEVRIARDGPTALPMASVFRPDVVLLDIGLPGLDGYEVGRRMRQVPEVAGALLVALTGYGQEEDRRRSKEAGFDHHLVKPVDPAALAALLASHRGLTEAADRPAPAAPPNGSAHHS